MFMLPTDLGVQQSLCWSVTMHQVFLVLQPPMVVDNVNVEVIIIVIIVILIIFYVSSADFLLT